MSSDLRVLRMLLGYDAAVAVEKGKHLALLYGTKLPNGTGKSAKDYHGWGTAQRLQVYKWVMEEVFADGRMTFAHVLEFKFLEALNEENEHHLQDALRELAAWALVWSNTLHERQTPEVNAETTKV